MSDQDTMTVEEARAAGLLRGARLGGDRASKYGNEPTVVDGVRFDSAAEAEHYQALLLRQHAGEISDLVCQPRYVLQEAFSDTQGRRWAAITYRADFSFSEGGRAVAVDIKGALTEAFSVRRRLFVYRYPKIELRVINAEGALI